MSYKKPTITYKQIGFSLVELMIALALGLATVAAIGTLSLNTTRSYRALSRSSESIENGRYALMVIKNDLEHAGFFGILNPGSAGLSLPASLPEPCGTTKPPPTLKALYDSLVLPIRGTCGINLDKLGDTGVLIMLRANIETTALSNIAATNTYIQTTPTEVIIGKNTDFISNKEAATTFNLKKFDNTIADIRQMHVRLYYIRSYSQLGDGIPTLMRKAPADADSDSEAIVEGIENLQLQYGLDGNLTTDCNSTPVVGDGAPDAYYAASSITCWKDWSNVVSVKVYVLSRTISPDPSYTDTQTYNLGTISIPAKNDHYHRKVFSQVVRLINVSARRER